MRVIFTLSGSGILVIRKNLFFVMCTVRRQVIGLSLYPTIGVAI
jgi:hypothetical protein